MAADQDSCLTGDKKEDKNMKKKDVRLKGQLRMYMQWPVIMTVLLIAMNVWMYRIDRQAGGMMSVFIIIYMVIVGVLYFYNRSLIPVSYTHLTLPTIGG